MKMAAALASIAVPSCRKIAASNRQQKIALRAENPSGPRYNSENSRKKDEKHEKGEWDEKGNGTRYNSPKGARRLQTGVLAPGDGYHHTRKPCKGERSFVPSALILFGPGKRGLVPFGHFTPACSLISLSGLGSVKQKIR